MRWQLKIAMPVIKCMAGIMVRMVYTLTLKMEEVQNLRTTLGQIREVMRFAPHEDREESAVREWPFHPMFDGNPWEDAEEENGNPDVEVPEEDVLNSTRIRDELVGSDENSEGVRSRHRITHNEAVHGAADLGGDEPDLPGGDDSGRRGPDADEDDESFELEELQNNVANAISNQRWEKSATQMSGVRCTIVTLVLQIEMKEARHQAMDKAMDMITEGDFSGSMNEAAASSTEGIVKNQNCFLMSVPVASFFGIQPVPRAPDALEEYRWGQIMQGLGPESIVVDETPDSLTKRAQLFEAREMEKKEKKSQPKRKIHQNLETIAMVEMEGNLTMMAMAMARTMDKEIKSRRRVRAAQELCVLLAESRFHQNGKHQ
eukprot:s1055_g21.t1